MIVLGIDVGREGAIARLEDGKLADVFDMPILRDGAKGRPAVNAALLAEIIAKSHATQAFVEFVGPRPGEGAVQGFSFGRSRGVIEGVCGALGVSITWLTAPQWKRLASIPPGKDRAKDAARSEAIRRWPDKAGLFARVKDAGRAESALIGLAGLKKREHSGA
jgi:crossover junction endodeoxyribonuclease RuvC